MRIDFSAEMKVENFTFEISYIHKSLILKQDLLTLEIWIFKFKYNTYKYIYILFAHTTVWDKYGSLNDDLVKFGTCSQVRNEYCFCL
jgi:hypothetical protein